MEWLFSVTEIQGFVAGVVHKFYVNLSENIDMLKSLESEKVYVRGHAYEFSPKTICEFLKIPWFEFDEFKKSDIMDNVVFELLGTKVYLAQE